MQGLEVGAGAAVRILHTLARCGVERTGWAVVEQGGSGGGPASGRCTKGAVSTGLHGDSAHPRVHLWALLSGITAQGCADLSAGRFVTRRGRRSGVCMDVCGAEMDMGGCLFRRPLHNTRK